MPQLANLRLSLAELSEQIRYFLAMPVCDDASHREHLWRLRDIALLTLGEARSELDRRPVHTIEPAAAPLPPVWLPSPGMREHLHARRASRLTAPFTPAQGPRL